MTSVSIAQLVYIQCLLAVLEVTSSNPTAEHFLALYSQVKNVKIMLSYCSQLTYFTVTHFSWPALVL